jgi:hypothetical protein
MHLSVVGVHPIPAAEPVHLIEILVTGCDAPFDVGVITQVVAGAPRENWQVPWDEHFLDASGSSVLNAGHPAALPNVPDFRVAFFFHHLDLDRPLETPSGPLTLAVQSERPRRLELLRYESPC